VNWYREHAVESSVLPNAPFWFSTEMRMVADPRPVVPFAPGLLGKTRPSLSSTC
jgi:hypothetical protein